MSSLILPNDIFDTASTRIVIPYMPKKPRIALRPDGYPVSVFEQFRLERNVFGWQITDVPIGTTEEEIYNAVMDGRTRKAIDK